MGYRHTNRERRTATPAAPTVHPTPLCRTRCCCPHKKGRHQLTTFPPTTPPAGQGDRGQRGHRKRVMGCKRVDCARRTGARALCTHPAAPAPRPHLVRSVRLCCVIKSEKVQLVNSTTMDHLRPRPGRDSASARESFLSSGYYFYY
jgi:hypothetical protein